GATALAVPADVEHQAGAVARLAVHGQAGQLLQRLQDLAALADKLVQLGADDGDDRAVALDVHVDVAVEVTDVQQALDVVGGDVALSFERLDVDLGGVGLAQRGLLLRHVLGIKLALRGAAALAARLARRLVPDDLRLRGGPGDGLPVLLQLRLAAGRALAVLRTGGLGPRLRAGLRAARLWRWRPSPRRRRWAVSTVGHRALDEYRELFEQYVRPFAAPATRFYLGGATGIDSLALFWLSGETQVALTVAVPAKVVDQPADARHAIATAREVGRLDELVGLGGELRTPGYHSRNRWM